MEDVKMNEEMAMECEKKKAMIETAALGGVLVVQASILGYGMGRLRGYKKALTDVRKAVYMTIGANHNAHYFVNDLNGALKMLRKK